MKFEPVIGLEVHVQLGTKSKLFCSCSTEFGSEPNSNTCPVCLGLPGSLPVLNEEALRSAIKIGLALNCKIAARLKFDRKNYFYPDLPKAYQISQYDNPVNGPGHIKIETKTGESVQSRQIGITRAHLEEDAGKLLHEGIKDGSLADYNRAGVPLLEIVSDPVIYSSQEAHAYLTALKAIIMSLGVSECDMEKGQLRCDANVSVRPVGTEKFGTRAEIKNLNSFKAVQKAIDYEIERQSQVIEGGEKVVQETRLWNDDQQKTFTMRSKEDAHDYRYFPEPDLVPFTISQATIDQIKATLPELPAAKEQRFIKEYGISEYDAYVLVYDRSLAVYFEEAIKEKVSPKLLSNWLQSELLALLKADKKTIEESPVKPKELAGLVGLIENNTISGKIAKDVLPEMYTGGKSADVIVKEKGLVQVTDTKLIEEIADKVIAANEKSVADFKAGKQQALGFLVGQMMKLSQGKANPKLANEILVKKLS